MTCIDERRYPLRTQRLRWLCVPAAIENVLIHIGEPHWTQERVLGEWYVWCSDPKRQPEEVTGTNLYSSSDGALWERWLPSRLNLKTPASALSASELAARFVFQFRCCSGGPDEALTIAADRLACQDPVPTIFSCSVPEGGAHMSVVTGLGESQVRYHDPGRQEFSVCDRGVLKERIGATPHILMIDRK